MRYAKYAGIFEDTFSRQIDENHVKFDGTLFWHKKTDGLCIDKQPIDPAKTEWNFQKFLIDEQGNLVDVIPPRENPDSEKALKWLEP